MNILLALEILNKMRKELAKAAAGDAEDMSAGAHPDRKFQAHGALGCTDSCTGNGDFT